MEEERLDSALLDASLLSDDDRLDEDSLDDSLLEATLLLDGTTGTKLLEAELSLLELEVGDDSLLEAGRLLDEGCAEESGKDELEAGCSLLAGAWLLRVGGLLLAGAADDVPTLGLPPPPPQATSAEDANSQGIRERNVIRVNLCVLCFFVSAKGFSRVACVHGQGSIRAVFVRKSKSRIGALF